jgi:RNA polymerase sigma-54 factor
MAGLNQKLQQRLLQKLSPQQIQLMKLLQLPTIALEQRIKQEMEENPALEEGVEDEENDQENEDEEFEDALDDEEVETEKPDKENDEFSLDDFIEDDETPTYKLNSNNTSPDDDKGQKEIPFSVGVTFHELLQQQLGLRVMDDKQFQIALHIIGNLDDSGYLERDIRAMVDDLAFAQNIETNMEEITSLLKIIQEFDPPGVGARNLQECLMLQLQKKDTKDPAIVTAMMILEQYFDEFTKKHYDKIIKKASISEELLKAAINQILLLNPKPGNTQSESSKTTQYIIPDFTITNSGGELELTLNSRNAPELRVSGTYNEMLQDYSVKKNGQQKEALNFVRQKIDSARWFIDAIKQRQATLILTMEAIMNYQHEYFLEGDETLIKPMILKDISEKVGLDISTISRVSNSKYVQTPFGTFLIKKFFSESMSTDSGEEVSTIEVKRILQDCIETESNKKPLTDDELAKILKEKGYNIARRTIAKYREQLNIPVARLRKTL